jgi:small subunit ribosomal protein S6
MFVLDDSRSNNNWDGVLREVRGLLERRGAEIFTCERWDERRLAYRINGRNRGVYLLTKFTAPAEAVQDIKRDAEMNDTILRLLVIRDWDSEKLHKAGLFPPPEEGEDGEEPAEGEQETEAKAEEKAEDAPPKEERSEEESSDAPAAEGEDQSETPQDAEAAPAQEGEADEDTSQNAEDTSGDAEAQQGDDDEPKPQQDSA